MTDQPEETYVASLTTELQQRPDLLALAEDDLALLRGHLALVTAFHNTACDDTARRALARGLQLPEPR